MTTIPTWFFTVTMILAGYSIGQFIGHVVWRISSRRRGR